MNGFTRYVLRQLLVGMVMVTMGLTCIIWLTQSLRFVEMIVNRGLSAGTFLYLTGLLLPNFLVVILPIAFFTIVVFAYSKMVTDRELVVMRAAGLSQLALAKPALILGTLILIIGYGLNLYLVPKSYEAFRNLQWDIRNSFSHVLLKEGSFNSVTASTTVYVRERSPDGQLLGILVHDTGDKERPFSLMAERGAMVDTETGPRVVMFNGNRQEIDKASGKLAILYFDRWVYNLSVGGASSSSRFREARERPLDELLWADEVESVPERDVGKFIVEGHKRLVGPLLCITYAMIGLASLLSGNFSRRSQTGRILIAITSMVVLQGSVLAMENVVARNLILIPAYYGLVILPSFIALYFLVRAPRPPRQTAPSPSPA